MIKTEKGQRLGIKKPEKGATGRRGVKKLTQNIQHQKAMKVEKTPKRCSSQKKNQRVRK